MAFSYVVSGEKDLGGAKMIYGTWNAAGVTTGTISIRSQNPTGTAAAMPHVLLGAGITNSVANSVTVAATAWGATEAGTIVVGACESGDTGTWYAIVA